MYLFIYLILTLKCAPSYKLPPSTLSEHKPGIYIYIYIYTYSRRRLIATQTRHRNVTILALCRRAQGGMGFIKLQLEFLHPVMIRPLRADSPGPRDWTVPSNAEWGKKWNIPFIFPPRMHMQKLIRSDQSERGREGERGGGGGEKAEPATWKSKQD